MILSRTTKNGHNEIYVETGWLTEAIATNFHTFAKTRTLGPGESAEAYKAVTDAEKTKLETADASWVRPPQAFIDSWNRRCRNIAGAIRYGGFNEATGYFELNGLNDITYDEALVIDYTSYDFVKSLENLYSAANGNYHCRTFYPIFLAQSSDSGPYYFGSMSNMFYGQGKLEVFDISGYWNPTITPSPTNIASAFRGCSKLRKVKLNLNSCTTSTVWTFAGCSSLTEVLLYNIKISLNFKDCPLITADSFKYMIENAINTATITITVHKNVYAKLTGDTTNTAAAALSDDELAQWMALVPLSADKSIVFATA